MTHVLHLLNKGVDALAVAPEVRQHPSQVLHAGHLSAPLGRDKLLDQLLLHSVVVLIDAVLRALKPEGT